MKKIMIMLLAVAITTSGCISSNKANTENKEVTLEEKEEKELESITASYIGSGEAGQVIDSKCVDIKVQGTYADGSTKEVYGWLIAKEQQLVPGTTCTTDISYKDKTTQLQIACTTVTEEEYRNQSEAISYEELARNPGQHLNKKVAFRGEVIQVMDGANGKNTYRINVTQGEYVWTDTIIVEYTVPAGSPRVLEKDIVSLYGESAGLYTYESTMGSNITIPAIMVKYMYIE